MAENEFFNNFFSESILEESDRGLQALFQSMVPTNANPSQAQQFTGLFQPTFQQFLGQLGSQVRETGDFSGTFQKFLEEDFSPQRALLRMPNAQGINAGGPTIFRL